MKTKVKIIAFAQHAILSSKNMVSIIDIFDKVFIKKTPSRIPRVFFVSAVEAEPNKKHIFSLRGELNKKTIFPEIKIEATIGTTGRHNIILDLAGVAFPKEGEYTFILSEDKEDLATTKLEVQEVKNGQSNLVN